MPMDYLKEGDKVTLPDGTFVEKNEKGIVVHNVPSGKGIFKDATLELWIDNLIKDNSHIVTDKEGLRVLAKEAIKARIIGTCSNQWNINPNKIAEVLEIVCAQDNEELSSSSEDSSYDENLSSSSEDSS